MVTRAYSICRTCAAVHPAERGCPRCDGDQRSAQVIAEATAHAIELRVEPRPARRSSVVAALGVLVTLALVLGAAIIALAGSQVADAAADGSASARD
jgi:hypothetical protein